MKISRKRIVIITFFILFWVIIILYTRYNTRNLSKEGVFILAKIEKKIGTKTGYVYSCSFSFKQKQYVAKFSGVGLEKQIGELVYVKILPGKPDVNEALYDIDVPSNLSIEDVPGDGWTEISYPIRF